MYLTEGERETAQVCGSMFIRTYLQLAEQAVQAGTLYWKVRPKFHYFCHVITDLSWRSRNPAKDATYMDEDVMKKTFHMKRRMCAKTSPINVIRRYTAVARKAMDNFRAERLR